MAWKEYPYEMVDPELPPGGGLRLTIVVVLVGGFRVVAVVVDLDLEVGTTVVVICVGTVISTSPAKSKLSGSPSPLAMLLQALRLPVWHHVRYWLWQLHPERRQAI